MRPAQLSLVLERELLSTAKGHHTQVMLWGPPGVGQSRPMPRGSRIQLN